MRAVIRLLRVLPDALELLHLKWARAELTKTNPLHPDIPAIVVRINSLETQA